MYIPVLDDDFTLAELNRAIQRHGRGTGMDMIDKRFTALFTVILRSSILEIFNLVFSREYPDVWRKQLLRPEKKKGHTEAEPKLQ